MKVIVVCAAGAVFGKETMAMILLESLKARGHDCICVTSSWGDARFREQLAVSNIPVKVFRIGFISKALTLEAMRMTLHQFLYWPSLLVRYRRLMAAQKPDVVIHTNFHHLFILLPVLSRKKNLYWSHEIIPDSPFYRRLFGMFAKRINAFVAVSDAVGRSLRRIVGDHRVCVVKNGISAPGQFAPETGRKKEKVVLAIIGQVSAHKGHELLVRAIGQLEGDIKKVFLRIIGDGDPQYIAKLKSNVRDLGLEDHVEWVGYLSNKADLYRGVDAVIVPSTSPDPYPTIIMESGFFGVPVIGSAIGGIPEMISEGVNGFLFDTGNVASLAARIRQVMSIGDFDSIRQTSRAHAEANFERSRFAAEFEEIISSHQNEG